MKDKLLSDGLDLLRRFCEANRLAEPSVTIRSKAEWRFKVCAYYRSMRIAICPTACADIGTGGRSWSYPGYTVDRTPFGALQHELGHHMDVMRSTNVDRYRGDFSIRLRQAAAEAPISGYCPDDGEWFAEMARVFITNPDLLRVLRPRTYDLLHRQFEPVVAESWEQVMAMAPERTMLACAK